MDEGSTNTRVPGFQGRHVGLCCSCPSPSSPSYRHSTFAISFSSCSSVCGVPKRWSISITSTPCTTARITALKPRRPLTLCINKPTAVRPAWLRSTLVSSEFGWGEGIKSPAYIIDCPPIMGCSFARLGGSLDTPTRRVESTSSKVFLAAESLPMRPSICCLALRRLRSRRLHAPYPCRPLPLPCELTNSAHEPWTEHGHIHLSERKEFCNKTARKTKIKGGTGKNVRHTA